MTRSAYHGLFGRLADTAHHLRCRVLPAKNSTRSHNRIAVIRINNIGDVVSATALIKNLRLCYPDTKITLITNSACYKLLRDQAEVDDIVTFDSACVPREPSGIQKIRLAFVEGVRLRKLLKNRFHAAFFLEGPSRLLLIMFPAKIKIGFASSNSFIGYFLDRQIPNERNHPNPTHRYIHYQRLLQLYHAENIPFVRPKLNVSANADIKAHRWLFERGLDAPFMVIAVGGLAETKRWPLHHWCDFVKQFREQNDIQIVLLGGPDERHLKPEVSEWGEVFDAIDTFDLASGAALIRSACLFVGNDTSLMHIAVAVGTPSLAIFGGSDWYISGYDVDHFVPLHTNLSCQPCGLKTCPYGRPPPCLETISPSEVAARASAILAASNEPERALS